MIQTNVIDACHKNNVNKIFFSGSSCIYPRLAAQPITEGELLTGALEPTNEPYAIAKIAGLKLCQFYNRQYGGGFRCIMSTNLYGPGDNYHSLNSHVVPGLIRRFHDAKRSGKKTAVVWGSGSARREFLHVDHLASAAIYVMELSTGRYAAAVGEIDSHINVGAGMDISIVDLANKIACAVGYDGSIEWDKTKPDGTPRKLLSITKLSTLGWQPSIGPEQGLRSTYQAFCDLYH